MKRRAAVLVTVILSFLLGSLLSDAIGWPSLEGRGASKAGMDIPVAALKAWFPPVGRYDTKGEPLDDESFDELMAALDAALRAEETLADFEREAGLHLWNFARRLARPEVTEEQMERISAYLEALAEEHPDHASTIEQGRGTAETYAAPVPEEFPVPSLAIRLASMTMSPSMVMGMEEEDQAGPFEDDELDRMMADLDLLLSLPATAGDFENEAELHLWSFGNQLQRGRLTPEQSARLVAYYEELKERHPEAAEMMDRKRFFAERLLPGQVAPNIVGKDTEGVEFELEEYRGNVVVLVFSGEWCGPCRGEYPYQRAMLEIYKDRDMVLLGVNSDAVLDTIRAAKKRERLHYRTWWDGHVEGEATGGPIATEWNVVGWPAIYILDEEGVIRHVGKRGGSIIAAVDKLLMEKLMREAEARRAEEAAAEGEAAEEAAAEESGDGER